MREWRKLPWCSNSGQPQCTSAQVNLYSTRRTWWHFRQPQPVLVDRLPLFALGGLCWKQFRNQGYEPNYVHDLEHNIPSPFFWQEREPISQMLKKQFKKSSSADPLCIQPGRGGGGRPKRKCCSYGEMVSIQCQTRTPRIIFHPLPYHG